MLDVFALYPEDTSSNIRDPGSNLPLSSSLLPGLITVGYWGGRLAYRALVYQAQNPEFYPQAPQKPHINKGLSSHWEAEAGWSEFKAKEFNDYVKPRLKKSKMCARVVIR